MASFLTHNDRERFDEILYATLIREMPEVKYPTASARVLRQALWPEVESYLQRLLRREKPELSAGEVRRLVSQFVGQGWVL